MSLEAQLAELNTNLKALTAALLGAGAGAPRTGETQAVAAPKPEKAPAKTQAAAKPAASASTTSADAPAASGAESGGDAKVEYKQVSEAVLRLLAASDRDQVATFLQEELGVPSAKALKPEQYAEALAKINARLAEVEA